METPLSEICCQDIMKKLPVIVGQYSSMEFLKSELTPVITNHIIEIMSNKTNEITKEYKLKITRTTKRNQVFSGHLDIFAKFQDESSLAVEIDTGDKIWSYNKLLYSSQALNSIPLWVRIKGSIEFHKFPNVNICDLTNYGNIIIRRPSRG